MFLIKMTERVLHMKNVEKIIIGTIAGVGSAAAATATAIAIAKKKKAEAYAGSDEEVIQDTIEEGTETNSIDPAEEVAEAEEGVETETESEDTNSADE